MMAALVCALAVMAGAVTPVAAQDQGAAPARVFGVVKDEMGRPIPMVVLSFKDMKTGQTFDVSVDTFGNYSRPGVPAGSYTITLKQGEKVVYMTDATFTAGQEAKLDFDFKEIAAKEAADAADAAKKNAEYRAKFAEMKVHFDAAVAALDQAKAKQAEVDKMPKDQQAAAESQVQQPAGTAVTEFQTALEDTADTDPNRAVLLARLGEAFEIEGKYPDAASAYQKAVVLKPDPGT